MIKEEQIQALTDIGLGFVQAKTYLSMLRLGEADVKAISKVSEVARQDVYRILPTLEKLGLAERILTTPTTFKATPLKLGVSILLQERKKKDAEAVKESIQLIRDFDTLSRDLPDDEWQFKITSERSLLTKMLFQLINKAQISIDAILPLEAFEDGDAHNRQLRKAMARSVRIRIVTPKPKSRLVIPEALTENPLFELRYSPNPNPVDNRLFGMHVFDRKEMTMCVSKKEVVPSLWSNGQPLLRLALNYFEDLWNSGIDERDSLGEEPQPHQHRQLKYRKPIQPV